MFFTWDIQTTLPDFRQPEFSVVRQHEEFVWLHDRYEEDEEYAGIIVSMDCSMTAYIRSEGVMLVCWSSFLLEHLYSKHSV